MSTAVIARCTLCRRELDTCAILNACNTCTDCARAALHKARRGTRATVVPRDDVWALFVAALHQAARGGVVRQNDVRPLIRGRINPKTIGRLYSRAKREGLLVEAGFDESRDHEGKNAGRLEPKYELRDAA